MLLLSALDNSGYDSVPQSAGYDQSVPPSAGYESMPASAGFDQSVPVSAGYTEAAPDSAVDFEVQQTIQPQVPPGGK